VQHDIGNNHASSRHWSLTIIAVDLVALWGLCVYGSRENLAA
jgi:hypothetical protein